jgi:hypothetical protein
MTVISSWSSSSASTVSESPNAGTLSDQRVGYSAKVRTLRQLCRPVRVKSWVLRRPPRGSIETAHWLSSAPSESRTSE